MERIEERIKRNAKSLTIYAVNALGDGHIFKKHIDITREEMITRKCGVSSRFLSSADAGYALVAAFEDRYNVEAIANKVGRVTPGTREEIPFFSDAVIGESYVNGKFVPCTEAVVVIEFKDADYINRFTGMPFDIVTMYLATEEESRLPAIL